MTGFRAWHVLALVAAAAIPALNTRSPAVEHDTWWHLRVGRSIEETGRLPQTDPFSRMSRDHPAAWRAYSWLYEWGLYRAWDAGGLTAVMWSRTLLAAGSAAVVFAFWFRRAGLGPRGMIGGILTAAVLMPLATERPWHFTLAFTTITAWAATAIREGVSPREYYWLPLVYVVWANVHIQFVLGLGVLGLAVVFPGRAGRGAVALLAGACLAATLVNPYHFELYRVVWEYATQRAPATLVHELAPPEPFRSWTLAAAGVFACGVAAVARRSPLEWFEVLFLLAAAFLAVRMSRDIWIVVVAAAVGLRPEGVDRPRWWMVPAVVVAVFLTIRLGFEIVRGTNYETAQELRYPVRAVEFIERESIPGPLYNGFDWGGFLIWAAPEYPVSIDGRTNLYGDERLRRSFTAWDTPGGWKADLDFQSANVVLAPVDRVLTGELRQMTDQWRVLYEDGVAVVFVRRSPAD